MSVSNDQESDFAAGPSRTRSASINYSVHGEHEVIY